MNAKVGAIVVAAAVAVGFAGGATAASRHIKAVKLHNKTTAHLENTNPGTRDVGFTG